MSTFKVGDKVKISTTSKYYGVSPANPANTIGTVKGIYPVSSAGLPILVTWSNNMINAYKSEDLELVNNDDSVKDIYEIYDVVEVKENLGSLIRHRVTSKGISVFCSLRGNIILDGCTIATIDNAISALLKLRSIVNA